MVSNWKYLTLCRRELLSLVLLVSLTRSKKKRGVGKRLAQTSPTSSSFPHPLTHPRIVVSLQCVTSNPLFPVAPRAPQIARFLLELQIPCINCWWLVFIEDSKVKTAHFDLSANKLFNVVQHCLYSVVIDEDLTGSEPKSKMKKNHLYYKSRSLPVWVCDLSVTAERSRILNAQVRL